MPRGPIDQPVVVATRTWIRERLLAHGFAEPGGSWRPGAKTLVRHPEQAAALHATLCDLVNRAQSFDIHADSSLDDHYVRWALNREIEGIVRCLTKTRVSLEARVFTEVVEWSGWDGGGGVVQWYFWYAPLRTLRVVQGWLVRAVTEDAFPVHERAMLLRAVGRLDRETALSVARELLDESPWAAAEVLGMWGGLDDRQLLESRVPRYRQRGFAEDRRKLEAAIRKITRRLVAPAGT